MVFNQGILDTHFAEVHLKTSLESIRWLAKCLPSGDSIMSNDSLGVRVRQRCKNIRTCNELFTFFLCLQKLHQLFFSI